MHLCRGNRGGHWHAEGSYEVVAERLFNALEIPFYFLEYDSPRAGSFTPLRFVPRAQIGGARPRLHQNCRSSRTRRRCARRLDDATKYVALDRLGVSPQCGFASVDTGNPVTPEAQKRKLALVVRPRARCLGRDLNEIRGEAHAGQADAGTRVEEACRARRARLPRLYAAAVLSSALAGALGCAAARRGPYPTHPVRDHRASAAGGNPDVLARLLANRLERNFQQPVRRRGRARRRRRDRRQAGRERRRPTAIR